MRYVLCHQANGRYLQRHGVWALRPDDAMTFDDAGEAREYCQAYRIEGVQAVPCLMPCLVALLAVAPPMVTGA